MTAGPSVGIAAVQECARPEVECDTRVWFGDNPGQGIAVLASNRYQIRALPTEADVPKFVFPLEVIGPVNFLLLVVWSKRKQKYRCVMGIVKAIRIYRDLIRNSPTVLIGDFNSNAIWDAWHPPDLNHSALITLLSQLGLVSSYHHFYRENHGAETRPTFYLRRDKQRPYHIDYCFIPERWAHQIENVQIGSDDEWEKHSDHRPLFVQLRAE